VASAQSPGVISPTHASAMAASQQEKITATVRRALPTPPAARVELPQLAPKLASAQQTMATKALAASPAMDRARLCLLSFEIQSVLPTCTVFCVRHALEPKVRAFTTLDLSQEPFQADVSTNMY
jgi:hypothetical protein